MTTTTPVRDWVDPTCPWAWQTSVWLRGLRDAGVITLGWNVFSLELSAMPGEPFDVVASRASEALRALVLAATDGGPQGFERLYEAMGLRIHARREGISPEVVRAAAADVGMPGVIDRAIADDKWSHAVVAAHGEAHELGVFGVPTISIAGSKVIYGPVVARPPSGSDALALWEHTRWLAERKDFFELKRWRDQRPD